MNDYKDAQWIAAVQANRFLVQWWSPLCQERSLLVWNFYVYLLSHPTLIKG